VDTIRRSWPSLIARLREGRHMILAANLESVTPASFDGQTLELAFPPDRTFGVSRVEAKADDLRTAVREVFGITPAIRCVVREAVVGEPELDEDPPVPPDEALALIQSGLDAEVEQRDS
jgi:hypothetical protein